MICYELIIIILIKENIRFIVKNRFGVGKNKFVKKVYDYVFELVFYEFKRNL